MTTIETINRLLSTHEQQDPRMSIAVSVVRQLLVAYDEIEAQQYQPVKAQRLRHERETVAKQALVTEVKRLEAIEDERADRLVAEAGEARRRRAVEGTERVIEVGRLDRATSPAEVGLVLDEAACVGPAELRRVWAFAKPVLERMARADMRSHVLPARAGALVLLVRWQQRVSDAGLQSPRDHEIRERSRHEKATLRRRVVALAELVGLGAAVQREVVTAPVLQTAQDDQFVVGRFWLQHPDLVRRR